jgi:glutathione S-transferase
MKFCDCATAPSPRRVRIFLAEKGLTVPTVQVDPRSGEQFTPAFRALNPDCTVPILELDSGAAITDIIAICRYFEGLHPDPPLMGRSAEERAILLPGYGGSSGMESTPPRRLFKIPLLG